MQAAAEKSTPLVDDEDSTSKEYAFQSKLLQEFTNTPSIDKAWIFPSNSNNSRAMVSVGQVNLLGNKKRSSMVYANIRKGRKEELEFEWSNFPVEMVGVAAVVPSPSGAKLFVVRNKEGDSPTQLEIWSSARVEKEIHVPQSVHGSVFVDGWFEGISWNHDESLIAYVAEEPSRPKPAFNDQGFKKEGSSEKDFNSWKCQGDWEEDWGETYSKKRNPSLFVVNVSSGEVRAAEGIPRSLSTGQVVWAPITSDGSNSLLVFVGWSTENGPQGTPRKLGIKYCYNRPCSLYAIKSPFEKQNIGKLPDNNAEICSSEAAVNVISGLPSSVFPRFSPDGKSLVFVSAKCAVDSGAHSATDSLHRIDWPADGKLHQSSNVIDVVPVVMCPENDGFPGLYYPSFLSNPWLSDGCSMILSSIWGSTEVILSVNILSSEVLRVSPKDPGYSWHLLALDGDNILAVCSSPVDPPRVKYGYHTHIAGQPSTWEWLDVTSPTLQYFDKIRSLLSSVECSILKIPVSNPSDSEPKGAQKPFEAIFVEHERSTSENSSTESQPGSSCKPLVLILHGGPHSVSVSGYTKSWAFLTSLGYNLLAVNYRGSIGFGEEALQSLPGRIGFQDVNDVLAALDYVIKMGLASASKVAVVGGSHGGFLTTHLIGQAPDRFAAAAARNPVCNLSIMLGTTDIPDWCYFEVYGKDGKNNFSEAPSVEDLTLFYKKSPIAHLEKVKTPIIFLLGAQDLRVPVSNGLQYARALREKGNVVKIIVFPEDVHGIERPQSDFESFLNIGVWFKKYL